MAWDVTVPDTYAESHIGDSVYSRCGSSSSGTTQDHQVIYSKLASTHMFYPIAIETAGTWDSMTLS